MGKYFGTDGFRGEANVELTAKHAYKIGRFLGYFFRGDAPATVAIGKDTRLSGYMLEYALVSGLMTSGAYVYLLHVIPTPGVAYCVSHDDFDCGIMISASHNPYYDNGIKIIDKDGHKLSQHVESLIEEYLDQPGDNLPVATKDRIGKTIDYDAGRKSYVNYLTSLPKRPFTGFRVGVDCSNGASSSIAKEIFEQLGAQTFVLHNKPSGTNINRHCGSTHPQILQNFVKDNSLDVGFAYDGDADRCFAVDENGRLVDGDLILYLCGCYFNEKKVLTDNTIVSTLISNLGLKLALKEKGINLVQTDVGDKYVSECMTKNHYILGGEQTGHIIFSNYAASGDGILTSLMIMNILTDKKLPLSHLLQDIQILPQLTENVKVIDKINAHHDKDVQLTLSQITKELNNEGRILLRESGTEPVLRIMVEAKNIKQCQSYIDKMLEVLSAKGYTEF